MTNNQYESPTRTDAERYLNDLPEEQLPRPARKLLATPCPTTGRMPRTKNFGTYWRQHDLAGFLRWYEEEFLPSPEAQQLRELVPA